MPLSRDVDAFGGALLDHLAGRPAAELLLEVDDGYVTPAMPAAAFFLPPAAWSDHELRVLRSAPPGPVLDLGCGAGRHALHFQSLGHEVTAVDISPGAIDVCRARGVADARLRNLAEPPTDRRWMTILLMCGNLGLAGGWPETRALLADLASTAGPGAVVIADSIDPTLMEDEHSRVHRRRNEEAGRPAGQTRLRIRYGSTVTPWWDLLNVPSADVQPLVAGTGWRVELHIADGVDHYLVLRRL